MHLSLRFIIPLMLVLTAFAYAVPPVIDRMTLRWFVRDLDIRSQLIANAISEPLFEQLAAGRKAKIGDFFTRITHMDSGWPSPGQWRSSTSSTHSAASTAQPPGNTQ